MKRKFIRSLLVASFTLAAFSNLQAESGLPFKYRSQTDAANLFSLTLPQQPLVLAQAQPVPPTAPGAPGPAAWPPGQVPPPTITPPVPPPQVPAPPERTLLPPPAPPSGGMVSLNFTRADLVEIIHIIAQHLRLTYTIDPEVKGTVTINSAQHLRLTYTIDPEV